MRFGSKLCTLQSWAAAQNSFAHAFDALSFRLPAKVCSVSASADVSFTGARRSVTILASSSIPAFQHATALHAGHCAGRVVSCRESPFVRSVCSAALPPIRLFSKGGVVSCVQVSEANISMVRRKAAALQDSSQAIPIVSIAPGRPVGRRKVHGAADYRATSLAGGKVTPADLPHAVVSKAGPLLSGGVGRSEVKAEGAVGIEEVTKTPVGGASHAGIVAPKKVRSSSSGRRQGARNAHSAAVRELLPVQEKAAVDENNGLTHEQAEYLRAEIAKALGESGASLPGKRSAQQGGRVKKEEEADVVKKKAPRQVKSRTKKQTANSSPPSLVSEEDAEIDTPIASLGQKKKPSAVRKSKPGLQVVKSEDVSLEGGSVEQTPVKRKRKDAPNRVWNKGNILSPWRPAPLPPDDETATVGESTITVEEKATKTEPKARKGRGKNIVEKVSTVVVEQTLDAEAVKKVRRSRKKVTLVIENGGDLEGVEEPPEKPKRKRQRKEAEAEGQELLEKWEGAGAASGDEQETSRQIKARARAAAKEDAWLEEDRVTEEHRQEWLKTLPPVSFVESQRTRLGYACICTELRMLKPASRSVFCSRHLTLKTLKEKGSGEAKLRALQNLEDLKTIIEWNERHGIRFFRMSSQIFPHLENPLVAEEGRYDLSFARDTLAEVGELARKYSHRLTFHPSHFNQLGAVEGKVLDGTFADLKMHADILDAMGCDQDSVLIVHGGGAYGDKDAAMERIRQNVRKMPDSIRRRLVFENDEKVYHTNLLLPLSEELQIPICVDYFHHQCYGEAEFDIYDPALTARIMKVWQDRGMKPKCHISEQAPDEHIGAHSDAIDELPEKLLAIARKYDMDIMLESKDKEQSLGKLLERYFARGVDEGRLTYALKAETLSVGA